MECPGYIEYVNICLKCHDLWYFFADTRCLDFTGPQLSHLKHFVYSQVQVQQIHYLDAHSVCWVSENAVNMSVNKEKKINGVLLVCFFF